MRIVLVMIMVITARKSTSGNSTKMILIRVAKHQRHELHDSTHSHAGESTGVLHRGLMLAHSES